MCSRLTVKLSTGMQEVHPGSQIPFRPAGAKKSQMAIWGIQYSGPRLCTCARVETYRKKWLAKGWETGTVPVQNFAEGYKLLMWAGVIDRDIDLAALHQDGQVVLLTRAATKEEKATFKHHRVPVQVLDTKLVLPSKGGGTWFV